MSLPYFNMYPRDFEADTSHLTLEEDGAYNRLLRLCWMTPGCTIPDDDAWIMRRMRVDQEIYDRVVRVVLDEFFCRKNGRVGNARIAKEFEISTEAHKRRVTAGKAGVAAKSLKGNEKGLSNAKAMLKQPEPEPDIYSVDKSTGAEAPIDPEKVMFDSGRKLLTAAGISSAKAGSLLGKWRRDHGAEAVITALGRAQREGAIDPVGFIEGCFRFTARTATPRDGEVRIIGGVRKVYHSYSGWQVEHV